MPTELACRFFAVFSRFEFALKESGCMRKDMKRAEPAWRCFGEEAAQWLNVAPGSALDAAILYLNGNPPQVQMRNGWQVEPLHGETAIARAIDAACRVRHNLFHGGKHTPHSPDGHDQRLVESALAVLTACLEQDDNLRAIFEQTEF